MIRPILFEMSPKYVNEIYCFAFVFAIGKMFLIIILFSLFSIILSINFDLKPFACATCLIIFLSFSKFSRDIGMVISLCTIELYAASLCVLGWNCKVSLCWCVLV